MAKEMSQKDLAQKVNEKPSIIQDYESGRAIPSPQILGKLERALGVKLRGTGIGEKLGGGRRSRRLAPPASRSTTDLIEVLCLCSV